MKVLNIKVTPSNLKLPSEVVDIQELYEILDNYFTEYHSVDLPASEFLKELQKIKNDKTVA
ncbi:MAG: hypothetical protein OEL89_05435 [Candidatus Peregrinibacteria bacterium]|nr:hypothetical protein [Candidatus Peregrinibacteria bacterium]